MEELKGTVIFKLSNVGSKSEAVLPYLYQNKDNCIKIYMDNDNPFENNKLIPYDGKYVAIKGEKQRVSFVISEISITAQEIKDISQEEKTENP